MPTRNVSLTEHQDGFIEELLATGAYRNASDVIRDGLRLLEARRGLRDEQLATSRRTAQQGWDDLDAGRYTEITPLDVPSHIAAVRSRHT